MSDIFMIASQEKIVSFQSRNICIMHMCTK